MQSFGSLLLSKSRNDQVEDAVKKDDNQNERVTIVLHLVDSDDETVSLSEDRDGQCHCRALNHVAVGHPKSFRDEISHFLGCWCCIEQTG